MLPPLLPGRFLLDAEVAEQQLEPRKGREDPGGEAPAPASKDQLRVWGVGCSDVLGYHFPATKPSYREAPLPLRELRA